MNLFDQLEGKKTYILATLTVAYNFLVVVKVIGPSEQLAINGLLAGGYVGTLRHAISKVGNFVTTEAEKLPEPIAKEVVPVIQAAENTAVAEVEGQ